MSSESSDSHTDRPVFKMRMANRSRKTLRPKDPTSLDFEMNPDHITARFLLEEVERKISRHLRKWLGLPPSFTRIGLYCRTSRLQLPFTSAVEEFKVCKTRAFVTLESSSDKNVSKAGVVLRTGRKWSVEKAVEEARSNLRHRDIVGVVAQGRLGLGAGNPESQRWSTAGPKERRDMVQKEVRRREEEGRRSQAVSQGVQGAWTKWEGVRDRRVMWSELHRWEPLRTQFLVKAVYDLLPTPVNKKRWGMQEEESCGLCGKRGTLSHILSGCKVALSQGRYRWRHDRVLRVLAAVLEEERTRKRQQVDLDRKLTFPEEVVATNLRPDMVLWSKQAKKVTMIELTVPWEKRVEEAHERKALKYQDLVQSCGNERFHLPVNMEDVRSGRGEGQKKEGSDKESRRGGRESIPMALGQEHRWRVDPEEPWLAVFGQHCCPAFLSGSCYRGRNPRGQKEAADEAKEAVTHTVLAVQHTRVHQTGEDYKQIPLVFVLMSGKEKRDYKKVFRKVTEMLPQQVSRGTGGGEFSERETLHLELRTPVRETLHLEVPTPDQRRAIGKVTISGRHGANWKVTISGRHDWTMAMRKVLKRILHHVGEDPETYAASIPSKQRPVRSATGPVPTRRRRLAPTGQASAGPSTSTAPSDDNTDHGTTDPTGTTDYLDGDTESLDDSALPNFSLLADVRLSLAPAQQSSSRRIHQHHLHPPRRIPQPVLSLTYQFPRGGDWPRPPALGLEL
ncbi:hypothetical protein Bbelb_018970 [Branchiostoma belcheri]|nr:hypothetical protein Bbelb_018970 [Branchiostoma belcheri]